MEQTHLTDVPFSSLDLAEPLQQGLRDAGFENCTPIQALTLPHALQGKDIGGQAQTGTGKTAAFLLAAMNRLLNKEPNPQYERQPRTLIMAPTRELAIQIHKDAKVLGKHTALRLGLAYGGTGYQQQREDIEAGVDILIGTPGRLIDYLKQGVYHLKAIEVIVLDEADRMFDLGFIVDIRYIMRRLPPPAERLGLLFSATMSQKVSELAYEHMNSPMTLAVETENVTADNVRQVIYHTAMSDKDPLLLGLLQRQDPHRSIIFVNTKRVAENLEVMLAANGIEAGMLSGDVPQTKRQRLLQRFQKGELPVLVATDVAARGLHIPEVSHVFNYDLPQDAEDYVHRIGRTARLGSEGDAISFACEEYAYSLPDIEKYIGHKIEVQPITDDLLVASKPWSRPRRKPARGRNGDSRGGPRGGGRPGGGGRPPRRR